MKLKNHKRITGKYTWVPFEKRPSRFPSPRPPGKPETRKPLYVLIFDEPELYFVNLSGETLTKVTAQASSSVYSGDDELRYVDLGVVGYKYTSVKNNEAVKIDGYGPGCCDFLIFTEIVVSHPKQTKRKFFAGGKGGVNKDKVLLWDNEVAEKKGSRRKKSEQ